ncbi:uncharacterized protein hemgn isoform X2 [Girardinichthys multiradiatus]|uniref:uncharacterized protein hemgn isoform X2 n=1 Tax=Girardinichthys multiradiatus TaxID=208333 RepID=UPI001FADA892|nr:uncharacterized protein hemgn isoform X2 [Girardinichthys multiradiatus]
MIRPKQQELSQLSADRMEETLQQEKIQEPENKSQNEEEGGIRRRLRDRELLRKRKAEAQEKETNQVESQRKRSRAENNRGTKRRGRPQKSDPILQFPVIQEEAGDLAVVVVPAPADVISDQILSSQNAMLGVESQQVPNLDATPPVPVLELARNSVFGKLDVDSAPVPVQDSAQAVPGPVQASYAPLVPVKASCVVPIPAPDDVPVQLQAPDDVPVQLQAPDDVPVPVQFPDTVLVHASSQDSVPAAVLAPPSAPSRVETLYTESRGREILDQVLIEDLGPDDEDDISPSQNNRADKGLNETQLMNTAEQNKTYSVPTLSSPPLPQEYLPGNQF